MKNGKPAPTTLLLRLALVFLLLASCGDDEPAAPGDKTPPESVSDLEVIAGAQGSLTLTWTAPGNDGSFGMPRRTIWATHAAISLSQHGTPQRLL